MILVEYLQKSFVKSEFSQGLKSRRKKREKLSHKHKMFLIFSLLEYLAEIEEATARQYLSQD